MALFRKVSFVHILLLFSINTSFVKLVHGEEDICFLYSGKNFSGSPLVSLGSSVKIFETSLIFELPSGSGVTINSVQLGKAKCSVILCSDKHLKGECAEYNSNLSDVSTQKNAIFKDVQSVDCHCPDDVVAEEQPSEQSTSTIPTTRKSSSIKKESPCANIFRDWHYHGQSHQLAFPGVASEMDLGIPSRIRSLSLKDGCKAVLWGFTNSSENEVVSLEVSKSAGFMQLNPSENFQWACCYCDQCSESVCQNAQASSKFLDENNHQDFSQFVKYGKKIVGIGRNYRWKKVELAKVLEIPKKPIVFLKPTTSYITEGQLIELPESLGTIFYELELGVVIGKKASKISESEALDYVAGYFLALDMTAKEFLKRSISQSLPWEIGKGFDTACPVGNFVPKAFVPDPNNVHLECKVNGEITQSESTSQMIFNVQKLIAYISSYITLEPYDVILTGTPDGFGPLKGGDVVEGRLGNVTSIQFTVR